MRKIYRMMLECVGLRSIEALIMGTVKDGKINTTNLVPISLQNTSSKGVVWPDEIFWPDDVVDIVVVTRRH